MGGAREGSMMTFEEHEKLLTEHDMEMRKSMKDSIIGAIEDLHSGQGTVQVMLRWSREFYDEIQKAGTESEDSKPHGDVGERRRE